MVPRFFGRIRDEFAEISGEEFHHMYRVLRLRKGDKVRVFDGYKEYMGILVEVHKDSATVKLLEELPKLLPPGHIVVAFSPPKGGRFDDLIEKLVEIGVSEMVPMICKRTVRRPKEKKDRWERIILSAVKQCGRTDIPIIREPMSIDEVLEEYKSYETKLAGIIGSKMNINDVPLSSRAILLIGPEGDFTEDEKIKIINSGYVGFNLGKIILRVETAAIVSASVIIQRLWRNEDSDHR